ncbi:MAG: hypothetical protein WEB85_10355 [Dongiaceae bacterium]
MAIRVLSGLVVVPRGGTRRGEAIITFDPFQLESADPPECRLRKRRSIGPTGRFVAAPASIVAARQFTLVKPWPAPAEFKLVINDRVTRDSIRIRWRNADEFARVDQQEIPFMVVGELGEIVISTQPQGPTHIVGEILSKPRKRGRRPARKARKKA